jgi:hypothetical protein
VLSCSDAGGTDHGASAVIASSTVWTAAGSPHRGGAVALRDGVQLSIEAGTVVCMAAIEAAPGLSAWVLAEGSASAPIWFFDTSLRVGGWLSFVRGDNMPAVGTLMQPVSLLTDSTFAWSAARDAQLCAQVVVGDSGSGGGATLYRARSPAMGRPAAPH